ncbi:hypothetical protein PS15m_008870 [Mucor circinelloides]
MFTSQHKKGVTTQAHEPETHVGALSATIADPKPKERPLSRRVTDFPKRSPDTVE